MTSQSDRAYPSKPFTLDLSEIGRNQTALVGGKAASLGMLTRLSGIAVPPGFCVTVPSFTAAIAGIRDADGELECIDSAAVGDPHLVAAARRLRTMIERASLPSVLVAEIRARLDSDGPCASWAVRSSATAEDSLTASFAGVHESYVGLIGADSVLDAIRRCWASAFGERAVAYRRRRGLSLRDAKMAVVVQRMAAADASGVLFTADPVSGDRRTVAIEACPGTGEALVSGHVVPQALKLRDGAATGQAAGPLNAAQARELADIGRRIERHFGAPQDIEWCLADGAFAIVQSRPITTLFPVPPRSDDARHVYLSVGHQQMMTDAMRPLGLSVWQRLAARPMHEAGGQLFVDVTAQLASSDSRAALLAMLNRDPLIHGAIEQLVSRDYIAVHPDDGPAGKSVDASPANVEAAPAPSAEPDPALVAELIAESEQALDEAKRAIEGKSGGELLERIAADLRALKRQLSDPRSRTALMAGIDATWWLHDHLRDWLGDSSFVDVLSRSVDNNVTSRMGLDLLDVADSIRPHREAVDFLRELGPDDVVEGLARVAGGEEALEAIGGYLAAYGMRCAREIDITRTRWREKPALLVPMILANIDRFEAGEAERRFAGGRAAAKAAEREVLRRLRALPQGQAKAAEAKAAIGRMRAFIGYREYPKYAWVRRLDVHRRALLREALRLVGRGAISRIDDIYYLRFDELVDVVATEQADPELIAERRARFALDEQLTPPRVLTSDGEMLFGTYPREGLDADAIPGLAVSGGVAEGRARVIVDPAGGGLEAGDILVTRYTDPSWTPLFLTIGGLVTEAGGQMSHGAVVAREYGLPAIVAVRDATRRIPDGQRIRIDGSSGLITLLEEREEPPES